MSHLPLPLYFVWLGAILQLAHSSVYSCLHTPGTEEVGSRQRKQKIHCFLGSNNERVFIHFLAHLEGLTWLHVLLLTAGHSQDIPKSLSTKSSLPVHRATQGGQPDHKAWGRPQKVNDCSRGNGREGQADVGQRMSLITQKAHVLKF